MLLPDPDRNVHDIVVAQVDRNFTFGIGSMSPVRPPRAVLTRYQTTITTSPRSLPTLVLGFLVDLLLLGFLFGSLEHSVIARNIGFPTPSPQEVQETSQKCRSSSTATTKRETAACSWTACPHRRSLDNHQAAIHSPFPRHQSQDPAVWLSRGLRMRIPPFVTTGACSLWTPRPSHH